MSRYIEKQYRDLEIQYNKLQLMYDDLESKHNETISKLKDLRNAVNEIECIAWKIQDQNGTSLGDAIDAAQKIAHNSI